MLLSHVPSYFKARRESLLKKHPAAVFLFPAAEELIRNSDVHHPFRQESNFYYLTAFDEPESFLVLAGGKSILFVRKRDAEKEMWEGERYGVDGALKVFGFDEAYLIDELDQKLPDLLKGAGNGTEQVYYRMGHHEAMDRRILGALETHRKSLGRTGKALQPLMDPGHDLGEMRLFKSAEEIEIMRKSCKLTALAHKQLMQEVRPGMNEFEVEAFIDYSFRKAGAQRLGYGSIVAGGRNATCLHYRSNNEVLKDGDLLLVDAGAEYNYFSADITRTFPVGRKFSPAQARAYDLVLKAQKEAIAMTKPGVTLRAIHRFVCEVLTDGLLSLGLLKGSRDEILKNHAFRRFYPHNTSHWLGMDVHDVGLYQLDGEPRPLEAGMVFTIEPGFYVQPTDRDAPGDYRDIGIRIEDDILVTASGCENLTRDVPKERSEIEALREKS